MDRWENRVAVVTGASSGIGSAIVKDLLKAKLIVVGLARRFDRLVELKSSLPVNVQSRFHHLKCDVSKESDVKESFDWIEKKLGGTDILINNAGTLKYGNLVEVSSEEIRNILDTNVMGIVYCTKEAFKSMKARSFAGHVVLINSVAGHVPISYPNLSFNIYPASKYAVTAMTEVYRQEFHNLGTNVKITSISPGGTATEIIPEELIKMAKVEDFLRAEDISEAVLYTLGTGPNVQVHEITIKPLGSSV